jgi:hypothetical protein
MGKKWKSLPGTKPSSSSRNYPISQSHLLAALARTNAAFFTHMIRLTGRHTVYDIRGKHDEKGRGLFDDEEFRVHFSAAVLSVFNPPGGSLVNLNDGTWLTLVEGPLLDASIVSICLEMEPQRVREVNRKRGGTNLEIGEDLAQEIRGKRIFLLLSYAHSGTSELRFAFQLGNMSPESVTVIVLFSRVSPQDEDIMRNIQSLKTPTGTVNLSFFYLCHGIIPLMHEHECPVCEQRWKIQERSDIPKGQLADFAQNWIRQIRPEYEENLKKEPDRHIRLWEGVDADLWHSMLSWRSRIEEAREGNDHQIDAKNLALARDIQNLNEPAPWEQHHLKIAGIVCLLANETTLFWRAPFYLWEVENSICKLAMRVIAETYPAPSASLYAKRMAIICMRSASKRRFAESLPKIAESVRSENALVMQFLYDAQTYVNAQGNRPAYFIEPLHRSLKKIASARLLDHNAHREILSQLIELAHRNLKSVSGSRDPHHQWQALREVLDSFLENRHRLLPRFLKTLESTKHAKKITDTKERKGHWLAVLEQWQAVWTTIVNEIAPRLGVLREVLQGRCAQECFGQYEERFSGFDLIGKLANPDEAMAFQRDMVSLLEMAANAPEIFEQQEGRFELLCDVLGSILLAPSNPRSGTNAALLRFLHACPCDPYAEIKHCVTVIGTVPLTHIHMDTQGWRGHVFCHRSALREAISETLSNAAVIHRRKDSEVSIQISVELRDKKGLHSAKGRPCILIVDQGTDPGFPSDHSGGNGIRLARESLESFGGTIVQGPLSDGGWQVMIFLEQYRQLTTIESEETNV